jgi:glutamyl/glutaminyl-tRNA synthetase
LRPSFEQAGIWDDAYLGEKRSWLFAVLELLKPRAKRLDEFVALGRFFFDDRIDYDPGAIDKHLRGAGMAGHLETLDAALVRLPVFDPASLERALRLLADERGVKAAALIHAARVAITGKTASPGLFETISLVGRDRSHARLLAAARLASTLVG